MPLKTKHQKSLLKRRKDAGSRKADCCVCGKPVFEYDAEYVKTKRGTELFVHTECVGRWGE